MSKKTVWMQGFDHLPVYNGTSNIIFNVFIDRLALLDARVTLINNTNKSAIGSVTIKGVNYKGLMFGVSNDNNDSSFSQVFSFNRADFSTKRVYAGCRISMSSCNPNAVFAIAGPDLKLNTSASGGEFTVFVEFCYDFASNQIYLYADGVLSGSASYTTDAPSLSLCDAAGINSAVRSGAGAVYSDYYIATEELGDSTGSPEPYGNLRIRSAPVSTFSGDTDYYNTLGLEIVPDLNSIYDENYADVGGYLHVPSTTGVLRYTPATSAGGVIAIQASGIVVPSAKNYGFSQELFFGDSQLRSEQREYTRTTAGYAQHTTVFNTVEEMDLDTLNSLNVRIKAAKQSSSGTDSGIPEIVTPVDSWYQPVGAVYMLPVSIYGGFIDDFSFKKISTTTYADAVLMKTSATTAQIQFTRDVSSVAGDVVETWQLSNAEGVVKQLTVRMTYSPRAFVISGPSVSGRVISLTFYGQVTQATTRYNMSDELVITTTGIVDSAGNAVNIPLATQVSAPTGYFNELDMWQYNATYLKQTIKIYVLDDFTGTADVNIRGKYSGLANSTTVTL